MTYAALRQQIEMAHGIRKYIIVAGGASLAISRSEVLGLLSGSRALDTARVDYSESGDLAILREVA